MEAAKGSCERCCAVNQELVKLKSLVQQKNQEIKILRSLLQRYQSNNSPTQSDLRLLENDLPEVRTKSLFSLSQTEILRYSRQLILPEIGISGQILLKKSSVLIVGAGGLGCPVGIYLAAAGIGKLGIVDYDEIELSNLHRQILYGAQLIGAPKSDFFTVAVKNLNPYTKCIPYKQLLNSDNIGDIILPYDIIVDATDNVATRYLLNDASVLFQKPLVSGSALRFEGQLTVYNYDNGPCYRCLYPTPPPPETTTSCSEGGVLGVVPGVIGCMQALEVIKMAIGLKPSYVQKMLLFDGKSGEFCSIKLRGRKQNCNICGETPIITKLIDYEKFCKASPTDKVKNVHILMENERISCKEYKEILENRTPHLLLDVRPSNEIAICHLPNCINIPFKDLESESNLKKLRKVVSENSDFHNRNYVVCRRGNDSQRAVRILQQNMGDLNTWQDIKGGLYAWHEEIDPDFLIY